MDVDVVLSGEDEPASPELEQPAATTAPATAMAARRRIELR